ncbi:MAG: outer membrane beta-barrel protein [Candidatus Eisenbacteria bacterium]
MRTIPLTLTGRVYLPVVQSFSPFLAAGAGWYNLVHDYSAGLEALGAKDETITTFGWHAGLGAKYYLSPVLSIAGEGRYTFLDPNRNLDGSVRDDIGELDYDSAYVGLGLNLEF